MNNKAINGMSQRRWLIGGLAVAALAAVLWAAYRPRPLVVETATLAEGRFEQVIEEDGRLRLQQRYTVTAPTAAQLQRRCRRRRRGWGRTAHVRGCPWAARGPRGAGCGAPAPWRLELQVAEPGEIFWQLTCNVKPVRNCCCGWGCECLSTAQ